ncbi:ABC transporter permease, partial [Mycobacterium sp. ITM-2017-0098]
MTTVQDAPPKKDPGKAAISERVKGERRLGLYLTLPSYVVMLLVTAYPLGYALVLSLYNFRLTDPDGRSFVGLSNYLVVLTDPVWWNDFLTTFVITVVTVAIELVLGFWFAFVMLRIV